VSVREANRPISGSRALSGVPGSLSLRELYDFRADPRRFLHTRFLQHGHVFKSNMALPVVWLVGEAANKTVLVTERASFGFGLGYQRTAVRHVFENSIMLQDGEDHARTRAILNPAVGRLAVRDSADQVADIWRTAISEIAGDRGTDAYALAERASFRVAANVLAGLTLGRETDRFRPAFEKLINGMMAVIPIRIPFGKLARALDARETLRSLLSPHVERARSRPPEGLVGQLAHARDAQGNALPTNDIVQHLLLLAWAGYDTTASAASWIVHVLSERVDWQERLRDELRSVDSSELGKLEASRSDSPLEWFLYEIERMYPSAILFPRVTTKPVEVGEVRIPADQFVLYTPYMSHRDPESFDSPNVFDPERFSASRGERRASASQLFGFGGGPRICLGKAFAKLQLKLMIHALVTRYRVEPDPTCRPTVQALPVHHPIGARVLVRPLHLN
jgi:cytochrome P450